MFIGLVHCDNSYCEKKGQEYFVLFRSSIEFDIELEVR